MRDTGTSPIAPALGRDATHAAAEAARRAAARIAPLWPLRSFVAVNPFLGVTDMPFNDAAHWMASVAGARLTMSRAYYLDAISTGRIDRDDLAAALAEAPKPAGPLRTTDALADSARRVEPARSPILRTAADVLSEVSGRDWTSFVTDNLSEFLADYFDEGQAFWTSPHRGEGLYAAWRQWAAIDRTPEITGLRGFRTEVAALPATATETIAAGADALGIQAEGLEIYFHRLLMTVGGWAAYARYRVWQSDLRGEANDLLVELLAIRLAWDVAIERCSRESSGFAEKWRAARSAMVSAPSAGGGHYATDGFLQLAFEKSYQRTLFGRLAAAPSATASPRPKLQAAFCIDVRSEVFRRALESVSPDIETIGFAGFFGFPIEYVPLGQNTGGAQCPVLLTPKVVVCEAVRDATPEEEASILDLRLVRRRVTKAWKSFKLAAVSSFAFVETMGLTFLGKLATDGLGLSRTVPHPATEHLDRAVHDRLMPRIEPAVVSGRATGFTDTSRVDMAEAALTAMSLTKGFGRVVMIVGHGSTTVNNPHGSGLDCGACGGHTGEANARVAAAIMNDRTVRSGLAARGITIPDDTIFLGALHDTTTDSVRIFDAETVPPSHAADLAEARAWLARAGVLARAERSARLHLDARQPVDPQIMTRSEDWAQVRPEWGLAGCAAFIAAPRARTKGRDLGGRVFLHDYDWRTDRGFRTLELIMTAPMVVASWISLQYFGSVVDNRVFGSGNKTLHNVVGTIGVFEGNGGDLRTGLPWQSLHDGEKLIHEPLRLSVVIAAPVEEMSRVIARHRHVRDLLDNGWLHLFAMSDEGKIAARYCGGGEWKA